MVGLAGESGCGKSTLVSTVLRLQPKDAEVGGEVVVLGEDVQTIGWGDLRALRWAGASIVFQGALHSLNPVQRVGRPDRRADPGPRARAVPATRSTPGSAELLEQVGLRRPRGRGPTRTSSPAASGSG